MNLKANRQVIIKRGLDIGALFCCLRLVRLAFLGLLLALSVASVQARMLQFCGHSFAAESFRVKSVLDGDTLVLIDGRVVRLVGVNTPELNKGSKSKNNNKRPEPYAEQATNLVRSLIGKKGNVYLYRRSAEQDKYGRELAHVFLPDGRSLAWELLRAGLAFRIAFDSNTAFQSCYKEAEFQARYAATRIWASDYWRYSAANKPPKTGFILVSGRVASVSRSRKLVWVSLGRYVVLKLPKAVMTGDAMRRIIEPGVCLEARGWLSHRRLSRAQKKRGFREYVLPVTHHSMVFRSPGSCD